MQALSPRFVAKPVPVQLARFGVIATVPHDAPVTELHWHAAHCAGLGATKPEFAANICVTLPHEGALAMFPSYREKGPVRPEGAGVTHWNPDEAHVAGGGGPLASNPSGASNGSMTTTSATSLVEVSSAASDACAPVPCCLLGSMS